MANDIKNRSEILEKLNIAQLNPMQLDASEAIARSDDTIVLSPTGTGKTLAFLLPILDLLDPECEEVQALILVPSRELAIQIEQVVREMGSGYKVNALYGGRAMAKDKIDLRHSPAILIGTPGRIEDHFRQERINTADLKVLVLDEFDKSLEVGFEKEMKNIISLLPNLQKQILTSATFGIALPEFIKIKDPMTIDYLDSAVSKLKLKTVLSPAGKKPETLVRLLLHVGREPGIIFCNFKDSIQDVSDYLDKNNIDHGYFHGDMEQKDRERALIKFRNGTFNLLIATDLAARGIDIPEMKFIVHYQLPHSKEEFTHRNGRTARVNAKGTAYILQESGKGLPDFISNSKPTDISSSASHKAGYWETLFISGGRKDKISKGDLAGFFLKEGNLTPDQLGVIELKRDCAFVAVPKSKASELVSKLSDTRLKKKKVRISIL